jgi:hypothetical protein
MVLYYLLWNYHSRGDATAAGAEALHAVVPKSVVKNIVEDFNRANFFTLRLPDSMGINHSIVKFPRKT